MTWLAYLAQDLIGVVFLIGTVGVCYFTWVLLGRAHSAHQRAMQRVRR